MGDWVGGSGVGDWRGWIEARGAGFGGWGSVEGMWLGLGGWGGRVGVWGMEEDGLGFGEELWVGV